MATLAELRTARIKADKERRAAIDKRRAVVERRRLNTAEAKALREKERLDKAYRKERQLRLKAKDARREARYDISRQAQRHDLDAAGAIVPRAVALGIGLLVYRTGVECKNGHITCRVVTNGRCLDCDR